jgi:PTS system mannose-specific IIC component
MLTSAFLVALIMFLVKTADHTLGQPLIERPLVCGALVGLVLGIFSKVLLSAPRWN